MSNSKIHSEERVVAERLNGGEPILGPDESQGILARFNPGLAHVQEGSVDRLELVYREIREKDGYVSRLGRAVSYDFGETWSIKDGPTIKYAQAGGDNPDVAPYMTADLIENTLMPSEANSIDDVRIGGPEAITGKRHATLVLDQEEPFAYKQKAVTVIAEVSNDFATYTVIGLATPLDGLATVDDRNFVLFRSNGKLYSLNRRQKLVDVEVEEPGQPDYRYARADGTLGPGYMSISSSDSLLDWPLENDEILAVPEQEDWEGTKINAGAPPVATEDGLLVVYEGIGSGKYSVGLMLLDPNNPRRVIGRLPYPILMPEMNWEREPGYPGPPSDVIFACGAVIVGEYLMISYGGADTYCGLARILLRPALEALKSSYKLDLAA